MTRLSMLALTLAIAPVVTASANTGNLLCHARLLDGRVPSVVIPALNKRDATDRFTRLLNRLERSGEIDADGASIHCRPA